MARATLIAVLLLAGPVRATEVSLDRPDLHAHFWASFALSLTLTEVLEGPEPTWGPGWGTGWALLTASVSVAALGLAKELTDDSVDGADLVADALGLTANALLQVSIEF